MSISITSRMRNAMVGLSVSLCVLFTGLIFLLVYVIEDQVFVNQLKIEQAEFEKFFVSANPQRIQDWQPASANMRLVQSTNELAGTLSGNTLRKVLAQPGVHEYFDEQHALFIAHIVPQGSNTPYYLLYNVKNLLAVRGTKFKLFALIGGLTLLITALAILLAKWLTQSTLAPILRLSRTLQSNDLDHVVIELANKFSEDEVGILARELALALQRVKDLATREYEFNRGVSHELRSPIQVAQSAVELLQILADEKHQTLINPISRLERSVTEMNEIAEAFLWLASDRVLDNNDMCSVATLTNTLVSAQSSYTDAEITIKTSEDRTSFHYPMPSAALSVVVRNLIRNAVIHGTRSPIIVDLQTELISVTNKVDINANQAKGFGVGLSIVQRICDRFNCTLYTDQKSDNYYSSSIQFSSKN